jgi:hypothetical protein
MDFYFCVCKQDFLSTHYPPRKFTALQPAFEPAPNSVYTIPSEEDINRLISRIPLGMGGTKTHLPLNEEENPANERYFSIPERFRHLITSDSDLELDTSNDMSAEGSSFEQYDNSFDSGRPGSPNQNYSNRRGNIDIGAIGTLGLGLGLRLEDNLDINNSPEDDSSSEDGSMVVGNGFNNEDYSGSGSPNRDYYDNTGSGGSPSMYSRYQSN